MQFNITLQNTLKKKFLNQFLPNSEFYQLYQPHPELEIHYQNLFQNISKQEWKEIINKFTKSKSS